MNAHDITAVLERLIEPVEDEVGSWDDVLSRAADPRRDARAVTLDGAGPAHDREQAFEAPRDHAVRWRPRRRVVVLIATALVVAVASASAFGTVRGLLDPTIPKGRIVLECAGDAHAPKRVPRGRCTVSGVITDRGRFADDAPLGVNPHVRTFLGTKGTIEMNVYLERGHWEISTGSRAYRGLRGGGRQSPTGPCRSPDPGCSIFFTMRGTVSG